MSGIEAAMIGTVVSDTIELRTSQAGKQWCGFNVGVGETDSRQYVRVSCFGGLAERVSSELTKGVKVYIEGHSLRLSEWTSRTGEMRSGLQMVASKVEKVGAGAIGRNKPAKQRKRGLPEEHSSEPDEAGRHWQRPAHEPPGQDAEIPF